ncbi:hypothetical protein B0H13DRAFT_1879546 [Mycena leptocephala]|nr:hypothetical protein B0H13DRAFT_1879546 [Mycena leptocephala]
MTGQTADIFAQAAYISLREIISGPYCLDNLTWVFLLHDVLHDDSEVSPSSWNAEDASTKDLKAYRSYNCETHASTKMMAEKYLDLTFFSLENTEAWIRMKSIQEEIKMKMDKHHIDLKENVIMLRKDVEEEKSLRRMWKLRRTAIDLELEQLRKGPLAGVRFHNRPTTERPSEDDSSIVDNLDPELEPALQYVPTHLSDEDTGNASNLAKISSDFSRADITGGVENESEDDGGGLEYFGPPTICYSSATLAQQFTVDDAHPTVASVAQGDMDGTLNSSGLVSGCHRSCHDSSPSPPSPPPIEQFESFTNIAIAESDNPVAPQDIDLEFSEHNIISGKRKRTSTADSAAGFVRPFKKSLYTSKQLKSVKYGRKLTGGVGWRIRLLQTFQDGAVFTENLLS